MSTEINCSVFEDKIRSTFILATWSHTSCGMHHCMSENNVQILTGSAQELIVCEFWPGSQQRDVLIFSNLDSKHISKLTKIIKFKTKNKLQTNTLFCFVFLFVCFCLFVVSMLFTIAVCPVVPTFTRTLCIYQLTVSETLQTEMTYFYSIVYLCMSTEINALYLKTR